MTQIPTVVAVMLFFSSCAHKAQVDDLVEATEFSQRSEAPLNTGPDLGSPDTKTSSAEEAGAVDEATLTLQKIRDLHMILHRYAKKTDLDARIEPAELGYQHEETIQTLAGLPESQRSSLIKSVLTLAVFEKSVYSFLQSKLTGRSLKNRPDLSSEQAVPLSSNDKEKISEYYDEEQFIENLDTLVRDYEIDVSEVLQSNRLLAFPYVHNFILIALENIQVSDELKAEIISAVKDVSTPWVEIYRRVEPNANQTLIAPAEVPKARPLQQPKTVKPALKYLAGDFAEGEDKLNRAKKLANKHRYSDAIAMLDSVTEDSPYYSTKREMIKKYSNLAVKSLRRKAAQSFQSAIPAPDIGAKLDYLKEAEEHLIDALEDYPEADQLEKVRENLEIIQSRIKSLESEAELD